MNVKKEQTYLYNKYGKELYLKLKKEHRVMLRDLIRTNVLKVSSKIHYFNNMCDTYSYTTLNDLVSFGLAKLIPEDVILAARDSSKEIINHGLRPILTDYGIEVCKCLNLDGRKNLTGHNKLLYAFMNKLEREDLLVVGDIEVNTLYGKSRPDILTMKKTLNIKNMNPTAYEIKHSRSDFFSDIKNPQKRASYLEIADKLYYVCEEGLIKKEEVPEECGLIFPVRYGSDDISHFKVVKKARVKKVEINPVLMMKMLLRMSDVNNTILISPEN